MNGARFIMTSVVKQALKFIHIYRGDFMLKIKVTNVFQTTDKEQIKIEVNKRIEILIKKSCK